MTSTARVDAQPPRVDVELTQTRQTPPPASRQFRQALDTGAGILLDGVESAASFLPGGEAVSAAVRGGSSDGIEVRERAEAPGGSASGSIDATLRTAQDQSMRYLQLQEQISAENRRYTALSNVLKTRHETAKSAINNIR